MNSPYVICFTGGPCGGKSTLIKVVKKRLEDLGLRVSVAPEAATILLANGFDLQAGGIRAWTNQVRIAELIDTLEGVQRANLELTDPARRTVLLCDRGLPDVLAYIGKEYEVGYKAAVTGILAEQNLEEGWKETLDRYDLVIHVATAAWQDGAYKNNDVRHEDPQAARQLDQDLDRAWCGADAVQFIPATEDFDAKIEMAYEIIEKELGVQGFLDGSDEDE